MESGRWDGVALIRLSEFLVCGKVKTVPRDGAAVILIFSFKMKNPFRKTKGIFHRGFWSYQFDSSYFISMTSPSAGSYPQRPTEPYSPLK